MKQDKNLFNLRGPVENILIETAQIKNEDEQLIEHSWFKQSISFNSEGQIIEQVFHNPNGSQSRSRNEYADDSRLIATRGYDSSGDLVSEVFYLYDSEKRLVAEDVRSQNQPPNTLTAYTYDSDNCRIKTQTLDPADGENVMICIEDTDLVVSASNANRIVTRYNEMDQAVEVMLYNTEGVLTSRITMTRDERGNLLEQTQYVGDVLPFRTCASGSCSVEEQTPLSDEQRAEMEAEIKRMFAPGTSMSQTTNTYNELGQLIESKSTMIGMTAFHRKFSYDQHGNKAEEIDLDENGKLRSKAIYTRKYDEHGNWTEELISSASSWDAEFNLSTPVSITRRSISYF